MSITEVIFDSNNPNWHESIEVNEVFLRCHLNYANDILKIRGHLFLNEVLDMLGFNRIKIGQLNGWLKNPVEFKYTAKSDDRIVFDIIDEGNILEEIEFS